MLRLHGRSHRVEGSLDRVSCALYEPLLRVGLHGGSDLVREGLASCVGHVVLWWVGLGVGVWGCVCGNEVDEEVDVVVVRGKDAECSKVMRCPDDVAPITVLPHVTPLHSTPLHSTLSSQHPHTHHVRRQSLASLPLHIYILPHFTTDQLYHQQSAHDSAHLATDALDHRSTANAVAAEREADKAEAEAAAAKDEILPTDIARSVSWIDLESTSVTSADCSLCRVVLCCVDVAWE